MVKIESYYFTYLRLFSTDPVINHYISLQRSHTTRLVIMSYNSMKFTSNVNNLLNRLLINLGDTKYVT